MKRILYMVCGLALLATTATAQKSAYSVGGLHLMNDAMTTGDLVNLSQQQFNFGTARSMGMAGAFTSLGADQASMVINPAGLGMYRRGEVTITPLVTISNATTPGTNDFQSNSKSRFAMGNIGGVFNVHEGSGNLLSFNIGFGYNRLADFNYNYSFSTVPRRGATSIADAMSVMLEVGRVGINGSGAIEQNGFANWGVDPMFWPGVAAYKTYLVDMNENGVWYPAEIGANATIEQGTSVRSRGSAGEFSIAMGGNINNKLYFGFTLGIQSIYQKQNIYYGEAYSYGGGNGYDSGDMAVDSDGVLLNKVMQQMGMEQRVRLDGSGVNFKLGVIYRPIPSLRLGFAFHTPTFYSIERRYEMAMSTVSLGETSPTDQTTHEYTSDTVSEILEDDGPNTWEFTSPARMMFGASYTLGSFAVLSVDYERAWYNSIRVKNMPYLPYGPGESDFKQDFKNYFKGSNNLRVGLEVRPIPMMAVRAGYGYSSSSLKEQETVVSHPVTNETNYVTAGLGFNLGRKCFLDVAYCYSQSSTSDYMLYYGNVYGFGSEEIYESDRFTTDFDRHNIALTFGVRF
ncbi:MAG: outer membrane protein transport protein [Rikenellaceae bacterium]|nr:outer membrane protein transport protein [Rikenellaceae bacterium]